MSTSDGGTVVPMRDSLNKTSDKALIMEAKEKSAERQTRTRLTFAQKVQILQRLENGEKQTTLAKELGCSRRALSRLKQNKAFFQQLQLQPSDSQRKSRHSVRNLALESNLTSFLSSAKCNGFPVTGSVVRHAALKIRDELLADPELPETERASLRGFQASINWSKAFVRRHGLRSTQVTSEDPVKPVDLAARRQVTNLLREYDLDCIISVEKFNMFYQTLPTDLFASPGHSPTDTTETPRKNSLKERVVIVVASNTTGSLKIAPTIVWKEEVPRCFDRRPCPLPHLYQRRAWLDEDVLKTWFCSVLLPSVRQYTAKKVALLVHDDVLQSEISDKHGQVQVLRVGNLGGREQAPLSKGVVSVLRRKYRYSILDSVIRMVLCGYHGIESGFGGISRSGGVMEGQAANLLDVGDVFREAWESVNERLIGTCWVKAGILPEDHNRVLVERFGRLEGSSGEEIYANCCTPEEVEHGRGLEKILVECRLAMPRLCVGCDKIDLVNKLNNVTRRELDVWFEVEETGRGLRGLSLELEEIIGGDGDGLIVRKGMKRSGEEVMVESLKRRRQERVGNVLPSAGYLLDLISPIERVLAVEEGESGTVGELVRKLKKELIGMKCLGMNVRDKS